jgi:ADP-ribosyl-[dinitrogen reductase] hydrolase
LKPKARTSKDYPLQIATIELPGGGAIGITLCPGKKDATSLAGPWRRDLATDVRVIKAWGASAIVCLMEEFELKMLKVEGLPGAARRAGLAWVHLPVVDVSVPDASFEKAWAVEGPKLRHMLAEGRKVLVHCRGGLGRSGTVAGRLLVEEGRTPTAAIALVRKYRPGAIETKEQEDYVRRLPRHGVRQRGKVGPVGSEDRAIGCLVGLAVGDALGTTLEFSARDSTGPVTDLVGGGPFKLKAGEWTDDTSMALCLADSLIARQRMNAGDLMRRFRAWRNTGENSVTGHCFDIGITTNQAIGRFAKDGNPLAGSTDPGSAGNGSIMRLAPVPIFFRTDTGAAEEAAILQSRTTHGALECLDACRLMTRIITRLLTGASWQEALDDLAADIEAPKVRAHAAAKWRGKKRPEIKSTGYVVDTLEAALWAVDITGSFSDAVLLAVNLGGDADTVGAVAGQLAGARYGYSSIPSRWVKRLAWSSHIRRLALELNQRARVNGDE